MGKGHADSSVNDLDQGFEFDNIKFSFRDAKSYVPAEPEDEDIYFSRLTNNEILEKTIDDAGYLPAATEEDKNTRAIKTQEVDSVSASVTIPLSFINDSGKEIVVERIGTDKQKIAVDGDVDFGNKSIVVSVKYFAPAGESVSAASALDRLVEVLEKGEEVTSKINEFFQKEGIKFSFKNGTAPKFEFLDGVIFIAPEQRDASLSRRTSSHSSINSFGSASTAAASVETVKVKDTKNPSTLLGGLKKLIGLAGNKEAGKTIRAESGSSAAFTGSERSLSSENPGFGDRIKAELPKSLAI